MSATKYNHTYRDEVIIPDRYNTGCYDESILVPVADKIPSWSKYIFPKIIAENNNSYVFENLIFEGQINFKGNTDHEVTFRNCKFIGDQQPFAMILSGGGWGDNNAWIFDHCEFYNYRAASVQPHSRLKFSYCYMHHIAQDGCKGFSYGGYENCYFYDLGFGTGAHADGLQTTTEVIDFYIKNCRFDMPATKINASNAGIFFVQEKDAKNCLVEDILIQGGGHAVYVGLKDKTSGYVIENLVGKNIKIGCNYHFSLYNCTYDAYKNWVKDGIISKQETIFVSSVYKDDNDNIVFHATNYTDTTRTLVVVTDKGTSKIEVPPCYTYTEGKTLYIEDFPFDNEYKVDGNFIVCYDTEISEANQIRYVEFPRKDEDKYNILSYGNISIAAIHVVDEVSSVLIPYDKKNVRDINELIVIANNISKWKRMIELDYEIEGDKLRVYKEGFTFDENTIYRIEVIY